MAGNRALTSYEDALNAILERAAPRGVEPCSLDDLLGRTQIIVVEKLFPP